MSVRQSQKDKRRKQRKAKVKKNPSLSNKPSKVIINDVKPKLIEYLRSNDRYMNYFKNLKRGEVYLIATEEVSTNHLILSEDEYCSMMPEGDAEAIKSEFSQLTTEKVVAYTEDDGGFMTYFLNVSEVLPISDLEEVKEQFREQLQARLEKRYETMTFDEISCHGSKMRFDMELAIDGYPFEIPEGRDPKDYEPLLSRQEYLSGTFDDIIDEVFAEARKASKAA